MRAINIIHDKYHIACGSYLLGALKLNNKCKITPTPKDMNKLGNNLYSRLGPDV
jgi:hypothetical protein